MLKKAAVAAALFVAIGTIAWAADAPADDGTADTLPAGKTPPLPERIEIAKVLSSQFLYEVGSAPFPSCHASTIVETTDGGIVSAFFGGTAERNPDVCIWVCRWVDGKWTAPAKAADGNMGQHKIEGAKGPPYPTWNPVLFQPRNGGPLQLYYKCGPTPKDWWGMRMTSTDDGKTWSAPERLPDGVLGPIKDKCLQLTDGTVIAPSSNEDPPKGSRVHFEFSKDNGATWTRGDDLPNKDFHTIQPTLLTHADGSIQMLARNTAKQGYIVSAESSDQGKTWSAQTTLALKNPNSGFDATTLNDSRFVLVYNPRFATDFGKGRTPLLLAVSKDGQKWTDVLTLENDFGGQYSYPAVIQTKDGTIHITYTWHRKTIKHVAVDPKSF